MEFCKYLNVREKNDELLADLLSCLKIIYVLELDYKQLLF
jgi:hypothetical protein